MISKLYESTEANGLASCAISAPSVALDRSSNFKQVTSRSLRVHIAKFFS